MGSAYDFMSVLRVIVIYDNPVREEYSHTKNSSEEPLSPVYVVNMM